MICPVCRFGFTGTGRLVVSAPFSKINRDSPREQPKLGGGHLFFRLD